LPIIFNTGQVYGGPSIPVFGIPVLEALFTSATTYSTMSECQRAA